MTASGTIWTILASIWACLIRAWTQCWQYCRRRRGSNEGTQVLLANRGIKLVRLPNASGPTCDDDLKEVLGKDFSPFFKRRNRHCTVRLDATGDRVSLLESGSLSSLNSEESGPDHSEDHHHNALTAAESLDRRFWQPTQRHSLLRRGIHNSAHDLMITSAPGPQYSNETPAVSMLDAEPTTPQRLANFLARPFRTNPLKRTKSVSKLDRKRDPFL
uniref:DUF4808 domain-containing protein n=1 Tax=Panagrellus redivivus TaxID=6233 RepID=A0A7E4W9G4_PANRE